ncbi:MAG: N(4)-(beta-N-acetylglucosaminyl)-L-asparaginase [Thermogutta sp.]
MATGNTHTENGTIAGHLVLSTWHFGKTANRAAWEVLTRPDADALDAVEAGCRAVEADPEVTSVGYGGLPDAAGEVTLDAVIMESPTRCGGVACLRGFPHPISVARRVMEKTPHVLLVGPKAEDFARQEGFAPQELLTPAARARWEEYRRENPGKPTDRVTRHQAAEDHDTVGVLVRLADGRLAGGCSTSGLAFKLPGRVGDSPIVGHGLYVDPDVGAAVGTGHGELISRVCGAFLIIEEIRRGATPQAAIAATLDRIARSCRPQPQQQAAFLAVTPDGRWASGSLRPGFQAALRTDACDALLPPQTVLLREN